MLSGPIFFKQPNHRSRLRVVEAGFAQSIFWHDLRALPYQNLGGPEVVKLCRDVEWCFAIVIHSRSLGAGLEQKG